MVHTKRQLGVVLATALLLGPLAAPLTAQAASIKQLLKPHAASYGYYIDTYRNNVAGNSTDSTNPALGLLAGLRNYGHRLRAC